MAEYDKIIWHVSETWTNKDGIIEHWKIDYLYSFIVSIAQKGLSDINGGYVELSTKRLHYPGAIELVVHAEAIVPRILSDEVASSIAAKLKDISHNESIVTESIELKKVLL